MSYSENTQSTPRQRLRISVLDVDPIETIEVYRNPTGFSVGVDVNWARMQVPGLPHEPKHYVGTSNPAIPFEFFYAASKPFEIDEMFDKQRLFDALAYPIEGGSMPRVLIQWPKTLTMICTLNSISTEFIEFARDGRPKVMAVRCELEEISDGAGRTYQEVRQFGWARAGSFSVRERFILGDVQ